MVPYASSAQKMIVLFKYKNNIGGAIVNTNQSGLTFHYQKNHAKTNLYEVIFKNVQCTTPTWGIIQKVHFNGPVQ